MNQIDTDTGVIPVWTFGDRMRKARRRSGMTTGEFAQALGITQSALGQYETDRSVPRNIVRMAQKVEALTGIPAAWMLGLDPVEPVTHPIPIVAAA
jgi:transcriptional regulator with XRE-family HTH domain